MCDGSVVDPPFIKNKVAQVYVYIFVNQYPHACPTFFSDLLAEVNTKGPLMVDIFFRILDAIDEIVVSRDFQTRSKEELVRNTRIKDAMRVDSLHLIAETWHRCLLTYSEASPELSCACIQLITKYISWIDIMLVVNDRILGELYKMMPGNVLLRTAACDCLRGIICKGMPHEDRCQLVVSMNLCNSIGSWAAGIQEDHENEFAIALAQLFNMTGILLIEAIEDFMAEGKDSSSTMALLQQLLQLLPGFLGNEYDDISEKVMELVQRYIKLLKNSGTAQHHQTVVSNLVQIIFQKMRFDEEHDFENEGDFEDDFYKYRIDLGLLLRSMFDLVPASVMQFASQCIETNLNPTMLTTRQIKPLDAELGLHVLYELAALLPLNATKSEISLLPYVKLAIESNVVNLCPHPSVQAKFFDVCFRCTEYFKLEPHHLCPTLVAFLGPHGAQNPLPRVRARSTYTFAKVLSKTKDVAHGGLNELLGVLYPLLQIDERALGLTAEDTAARVHLFEGAGYIIIGEHMDPQNQSQMLTAIFTPLMEQYKTITEMFLVAKDPATQAQCEVLLDHIPTALTALCKRVTVPFLDACGCRQVVTLTICIS